nr:MAG TPA: hypothetical protein [Caudoviricetes sp.]
MWMTQSSTRRSVGWLLRLTQTADAVWEWKAVKKLYLWPEYRPGRNVYSDIGLGAESWRFRLRPGQVDRSEAILFDGCYHTLTAVSHPSPGTEQWDAARVLPVTAVRTRMTAAPDGSRIRQRAIDPTATLQFPAIVTERYRGAEQGEQHATETHTLVAVVPKPITCALHDILTIDGRQYVVTEAHEQDSWRNSYAIRYQGDV